jgi:hypothetical protein
LPELRTADAHEVLLEMAVGWLALASKVENVKPNASTLITVRA